MFWLHVICAYWCNYDASASAECALPSELEFKMLHWSTEWNWMSGLASQTSQSSCKFIPACHWDTDTKTSQNYWTTHFANCIQLHQVTELCQKLGKLNGLEYRRFLSCSEVRLGDVHACAKGLGLTEGDWFTLISLAGEYQTSGAKWKQISVVWWRTCLGMC